MRNLLKTLIAVILIMLCIFAFASCQLPGGTDNTQGGEDNDNGSLSENMDNSYRIRFVYSYTAKVENDSGRIENKKNIVTVESFYVPKDNTGLSDEMVSEMKALSYHGFTFVNWFSSWDTDTQCGIAGTEYNFSAPVTSDITIFCDRGNLAGPSLTWSLEYLTDETSTAETEDEVKRAVLKIEGSGDMFNFLGANEIDVPWHKYRSDIVKIVVGDGVSSIGNNAFGGLSNATEVDLPDSIKRIGEFSFSNTSIAKLVAPASLEEIGKSAFSNTALKEVTLNDGLRTLGEKAFHGSNKIKTIVFPSSIETIEVATFHPGQVNNKNNSHALSKVYYTGTKEQFDKINIAIDNTWFSDKATIYYYQQTPDNYGQDGAEVIVGNYWHYASDTSVPVQYCFTVKYVLGDQKVYLDSFYVPAVPVMDENGQLVTDEEGNTVLEGVITAEHIRLQKSISYHNYQFAGFVGADPINVGDKITADITYKCDRGSILSPDSGIIFTIINNVLTISLNPDTRNNIEADILSRIDEEGIILLTKTEMDILETDSDSITITEEEITKLIDSRLENSYKMWDFVDISDANGIWSYGISQINIGEGIKYIGKLAFGGISRTASIVIPASVEEIHPNAFDGCTDLTAVYYMGTATEAMNGLSNPRFTVYSLVTEGTADAGSYWLDITKDETDYRLCWTITSDGMLTIGGSDNMINFDQPSDAPWYVAKDAIKSVKFASNIYSIGENALYGYEGVMSIDIPKTARIIPASSIANTGMLNNFKAYENGALVINGHLVRVNPSVKSDALYETFTGIVTITDGAFDGYTGLKALYVARTVQYIDPGAFADCSVESIFVEGTETFWAIIDDKVDFNGAKVYFKHTNPTVTITNEEGKKVTVMTSSVDDKYWFKSGDEYIIWGCRHTYGEYVDDNNATCTDNATETATCTQCGRTDTVEIPDSTKPHLYDETTHICTEGCGLTDPTYQEGADSETTEPSEGEDSSADAGESDTSTEGGAEA